jgi:Ran GTPase-activating protein (RanGAP) involved in mRNA processing and transport
VHSVGSPRSLREFDRTRRGRELAGVLAQCAALAHLNLCRNLIGPDGAESLAGVLAQCAALAHLKLGCNWIEAAGTASLAGVLAQCAVLAHLDLRDNLRESCCSAQRWLTSISATNRSGQTGQRALRECWRNAQR